MREELKMCTSKPLMTIGFKFQLLSKMEMFQNLVPCNCIHKSAVQQGAPACGDLKFRTLNETSVEGLKCMLVNIHRGNLGTQKVTV
jgi:hypothetical protein